jgi:hypothetical protein
MRQSNLVQRINNSDLTVKVNEPFKVSDFYFLIKNPSFFSKHAIGNGKYREYFIGLTRGKYKLKQEN